MTLTVPDEREPLIGRTEVLTEHGSDLSNSKYEIVGFEGEGDSENPLEWQPAYKWTIVGLLAFMAFTTSFTCISVVPVADSIVTTLNDGHRSKSASVLLVTIWELGEAAGPLLVAPLSEFLGRARVYHAANILFIVATIVGGCCQSSSVFIAARALNGFAVAANVLNPAIVGDIFPSEKRGSPMSLMLLAPMTGGAIGPAIAGAIAERWGWRNILWMSAGLAMACEGAFLLWFRETYSPAILRAKVDRLKNETGNVWLTTEFDIEDLEASEDGKRSVLGKLLHAIARPFVVYFGSGVLQAISAFGCVTFCFYYILSTTLPDILEGRYGLSPTITGFCFISLSIGSIISVLVCNFTLDRIYNALSVRYDTPGGHPEYRLPIVIIGSLVLPPLIASLGWTAQVLAPLPVLLLDIIFVGAFMLFGYLPVTTYVVDAFGLYSASAMTALIVTRCLAGTFLPLLAAPLIERFELGWAFTILGGIAIYLAPIPAALFRWGGKWRQRSKYSKEA